MYIENVTELLCSIAVIGILAGLFLGYVLHYTGFWKNK